MKTCSLFPEKITMRNRCDSILQKIQLLFIGGLLIQVMSGCQSRTNYYTIASEKDNPLPPRVVLMPGDLVEIKFFYTPQLDEIQTIRPDGKMALQLIGEVEVQEMTPDDLRSELTRLYTPYLRDPNVTVIVRSFFNRRVFVGGQVMKPGIVEMPGKLMALEAIIQAGGFNIQQAELRNVIVIRHKDNQRYAYSLDLKPILTNGEIQPFFLEPQDIVYVPQTKIAKANQWVDQHINKLIPQTGFFFSRTIGQSTIGLDTSAR
jgi:protein involved in polysaccharide export with SLBB domain